MAVLSACSRSDDPLSGKIIAPCMQTSMVVLITFRITGSLRGKQCLSADPSVPSRSVVLVRTGQDHRSSPNTLVWVFGLAGPVTTSLQKTLSFRSKYRTSLVIVLAFCFDNPFFLLWFKKVG